jgi:fumarylacetoacetase
LRYSAPASSEPPPRPTVVYAASERVDYELELAAIVGKPIPMRSPLKPQEVDDHVFGFVVMNDWSGKCMVQ